MGSNVVRKGGLPVWLLAALPPLLLGLARSLLVVSMYSRVVWGGPTPYRFFRPAPLPALDGASLALCLLLVAGAGLGLLLRLPRWSHTWIASAACIIFIAWPVLNEASPLVSPLLGQVLNPTLLIAWVLALLVAAWRGWEEAALAGMGLSTGLAVSMILLHTTEITRPDIVILAAPLGLAFAVCIALFLHQRQRVRRLAFLGAVVGLSGVPFWLAELSTLPRSPDLLWGLIIPPVMLASALVTPLLLCGLFSLFRAFGRRLRLGGRP